MRGMLVVVLVLLAGSAWAGRLVVPEAVCLPAAAEAITLGHLARAEGEDAEAFLERWGAAALVRAPGAVGRRLTVDAASLRQALARAVPAPLPELVLPEAVTVQRGGQVLAVAPMLPALERAVAEALAVPGGEVRLRDWRLPGWMFLASEQPARVRLVPPAPGGGTVAVHLEAVDEAGAVVGSLSGTVTAEVWAEVPCAVRSLARGEVVGPEAVVRRRVNLAAVAKPVWDGAGMGGVRVRGQVPAGAVLLTEMLEPVPVVERGRTVTLVYDNGRLRLAVPAQSLEDGGVGGLVRVRNLQSQRVVSARVVDASTVQVGGL